jgi:membrane protein implicated in regulation of membrane protease activity
MSGWLFDPWVWVALAAALMLAELALPGYIMLGFGLSAAMMAPIVWALPESVATAPLAGWLLLLAFALDALALWFVLSRRFGRGARGGAGKRDINDFENRG